MRLGVDVLVVVINDFGVTDVKSVSRRSDLIGVIVDSVDTPDKSVNENWLQLFSRD